jgi:DNA-binding CsgD family transcriptional regulator
MVISLAHTVLSIQGKSFPGRWKAPLWTVVAFVAGSYLVQGVGQDDSLMSMSLVAFHSGLFIAVTAVLFVVLLSLLLYARRSSSSYEKKLAGSFGWFYFSAFLVLSLSAASLSASDVLVSAFTLLLINLFPVFWVLRMIKPVRLSIDVTNADGLRLDTILNPYQVSKREKEIAGLILVGKSNKEIKNELFISSHTVKNHIYSMYRKLGIRSRGQLINLILESSKGKRGMGPA